MQRRIEAQALALRGQRGLLSLVAGHEAGEHPCLALGVGDADHDALGHRRAIACLLEALSTIGPVVRVVDEHHEVGHAELGEQQQHAPRQARVVLARVAVEEAHGHHAVRLRERRDVLPRGELRAGLDPSPRPQVLEVLGFEPLDSLHQAAIDDRDRGDRIG